jgi:biopolymer transport protein ExbD/biopolymer transport protein TolR
LAAGKQGEMQVGKARKQLLDEINITPLTDVFLVLLIIMMVVAPLLHLTRNEIKVPQVEAGTPIKDTKLVIEVTQDGVFFVDGIMVAQEELSQAITRSGLKFAEKDIVIRADKNTRAGAVLSIFDAAKSAQFSKVTVIVESLNAQRQQELRQIRDQQKNPDETTQNVQ